MALDRRNVVSKIVGFSNVFIIESRVEREMYSKLCYAHIYVHTYIYEYIYIHIYSSIFNCNYYVIL